jgi:hypothetical protein
MTPAHRLTPLVLVLAALSATAAAVPFVYTGGTVPTHHTSVRGEPVVLYGHGPYRHMPADVAVQGFAQDAITLAVGVPFLVYALLRARRGGRAAHLALAGGVAYLLVQYVMYLAMATYNELFIVWIVTVQLAFQAFVRLLLAQPAADFEVPDAPAGTRRFVGFFLIGNGALITLLWLGVIVPPLLEGALYPKGLAHFTTMIVQGFDLALFLPPSLLAGYLYLRKRSPGALLAGTYSVFLCLQMLALLAKIVWMSAVGASSGPALVIIPVLLVGALVAATLALRSHGHVLPIAPGTADPGADAPSARGRHRR